MNFSPFPLNAKDAADWYIARAEQQSIDVESAQHLIQSFVSCGAHTKAIDFVYHLPSVPTLFGPCSLTLLESLCEYRYASQAREALLHLKEYICSKSHSLKPCDLYLVIAETTKEIDDFIKAKKAVLAEQNLNERALRLIRILNLADELDINADNNALLSWIRTHLLKALQENLTAAFLISAALTVLTEQEQDFLLTCEITGSIVSQLSAEASSRFTDELIEIASHMPKKIVQRVLKKQTSSTVRKKLQLALLSEPSIPEESLH